MGWGKGVGDGMKRKGGEGMGGMLGETRGGAYGRGSGANCRVLKKNTQDLFTIAALLAFAAQKIRIAPSYIREAVQNST